ncbi:TIGR04222 domain-containing membrane protein [Nonomuraea typhae]|uniref:TIGR04222 domain-containing membrane protein n=1 Tax=Nonomuraea typhae TaxID=2603600 RepID=UPI0012FB157E|nr:TIGR04222 domain-containing membrane protein [Nonomuraea typhae]
MDLVLLIVSVFLAVASGATVSALKREHSRIRSTAVNGNLRDLGHYELAYLAGGPRRVVNTAIGLLAKSGELRVSRGGALYAVSTVGGDPIEDAVLAAVAARPNGVSAAAVRNEVGNGPAVDSLRHELAALGLVLRDGELAGVRSYLARLLALAVGALVASIGLAIYVVFAGGGPLAVFAMAVTAGTWIGSLAVRHRQGKTLTSDITLAGREQVMEAGRLHTTGGPLATATAAAVAVPVALYGLGSLGDPQLEAELQAHRNQHGQGASACAAGSCGGGSDSSASFSFGGGGDFGGSSADGGGGSSCGGGGCGGGCGGGGG